MATALLIEAKIAIEDRRARIGFNIGPVSQRAIAREEEDVATLTLTDIQKASLSIDPRDAAGNPAAIDGAPTWGTSDESVLDIAVAEDGRSATITTTGKLGSAQVSVSADADLGEGITTLTGTLDVEVTASQATTLGITTGTPEDR